MIGGFHSTVRAQVTAFGGFIARSFGDGFLAYFGYPRAHEDDAERAARSALASSRPPQPDGARRHRPRSTHRHRVGLGRPGRSGRHRTARGRGRDAQSCGTASKYRGSGFRCGFEQTARLLGNAFELVDLGSQALKGFRPTSAPVSCLRPAQRRASMPGRSGVLTALVGRDADLGALLERWRKVQAGEGQVVLITGEPGIGKSRTVHSFQDSLADHADKVFALAVLGLPCQLGAPSGHWRTGGGGRICPR